MFAASGDEALAWRLSHGVFALYHVLAWQHFARRLDVGSLVRRDRWVFFALSWVGVPIVLAQLAVALGAFTPVRISLYFAALLWFLLVGLVQFALLLARHE